MVKIPFFVFTSRDSNIMIPIEFNGMTFFVVATISIFLKHKHARLEHYLIHMETVDDGQKSSFYLSF